ncbi:hypothetical protein AB0M43_20515 [Longispora sp. NPDC051575]|uniref:hypothetical protein n=1 Tax=Longispora sp. NPDC051575 TaxID=3154943 RepID=UPI003443427C
MGVVDSVDVRDRVGELLAAGTRVVNLVGPVGIGKSRLMAELAGPGGAVGRPGTSGTGGPSTVPGADTTPTDPFHDVRFADEVNDEAAVARLTLPAGPLVVASRRPLPAHRSWDPEIPVAVVHVEPWPDARIAELVAASGVDDPASTRNVVRLSAGVPLLARELCRALRAAEMADAPGAVVHAAVAGVLRRLAVEDAGTEEALLLLATVGQADGDLLTVLGAGPAFAALAESSVVVAVATGLAVAEPYRTVFDLAHEWRSPVGHRTAATRAAAHHGRLLATEHSDRARADRVAQALFLTVPDPARRLFRPVTAPAHVRPAGPGDADDVARLVRRWARWGSLGARRTERLLDGWMRTTPDGFHLVCDREGHAVGLANVFPVTDRAMATMEPLLQQHTAVLTPGKGAFIGLATYDDRQPAARAALFRFLLAMGIQHNGMVISTPSREYQRLAAGLGLHAHGATRDDVLDCGRPNQVYSHDFETESLPRWLDRLRGPGLAPVVPDDAGWVLRQLREALDHVHEPLALARSPLLAVAGGPGSLRDLLVGAIGELQAGPAAADVEAGEILARYYLERRGGHEHIAMRLHLSRATYYRRLHHGLARLARPFVVQSR